VSKSFDVNEHSIFLSSSSQAVLLRAASLLAILLLKTFFQITKSYYQITKTQLQITKTYYQITKTQLQITKTQLQITKTVLHNCHICVPIYKTHYQSANIRLPSAISFVKTPVALATGIIYFLGGFNVF
jgi:hypothetical protein